MASSYSSYSSSSCGSLSASDLEAGFSGCPAYVLYRRAVVSRTLSSPRPRRLFCFDDDDDDDDACALGHFLDSCFLCRKPLARNRDIFMYRGDTPFCSEECRQEQIDMDEAKEKSRKLSSSKASGTARKEQQQKSASKIHVRASTAVAG